MYKIIGGDGNEYGPVSAEQVHQWIAEGRANTQTKARREGETEWKPLAAFPEFANALVAQTRARLAEQPANAPSSFRAGGAETAGATALAEGDYELDLGGCISRGWELLKGNFGPLFGGFLVYVLVAVVLGILSGIPFVGPIFSLANLVVTGPLMGGLYYLYLKVVRGEMAEVGDVFAGFRKAFMQLFLGYLVPGLLSGLCLIPVAVVAGITLLPSLKHGIENFHPETAQLVIISIVALLCLIPMIFLQMSWIFTMPLIIDREMDFWTAMKTSWKRVNLHWWQVFGLVLLIGLVNVVGVLVCCVGVLVTMPVGFAALMYAYETIFSGDGPRGA